VVDLRVPRVVSTLGCLRGVGFSEVFSLTGVGVSITSEGEGGHVV